ncbi:hypothetical protein [Clostridium beijerinckii]|uniref:hypothetical protein n=1 Tax=Clostridium beijerinckii TaxID=1520 RepID=UPI001F1692FC|nr:hypothetical protein [Clostridium beijerinckii]
MSETMKVAILTAILTTPTGYLLHVLKSKFDKKEIIRSTNRLFKADVNKILQFSKKYNESEVYGVVTDKLSSFDNWKGEFNKISSSLDDEQSSQLIDIYSTVSEIMSIQNECREYNEEIKRKHPSMRGPADFGDGVMTSLNREFDESLKHLVITDYEQLLSILEYNSI